MKQNSSIEMYNYYRVYYNSKAAKQLTLFSGCLRLNPKLMTQCHFASRSCPIWLPLCRVEETLTNSYYVVREVGTGYTQCVHRVRLRPVTTQSRVDDLTVINFENFQHDPSMGHFVINQRFSMRVFLCWNLPSQWLQHKM